ncbi:hypothetical protein [Brachybacterium phenoliresistens]|uniref:hypothetical protein n=1 Tax=Brachybacterium phenoliresistens TaxID=396014 RepID=UPI0031D99CE3
MSTPLERITALVADRLGEDGQFTSTPVLTLEEFFEGNEAEGSILCNVVRDPQDLGSLVPPQEAFEIFSEIRDRSEVADVRIALTMFDDPDWPFSDTVLVETIATPEEVRGWFEEEIGPDEVDPLAPDDDLVDVVRELGMDPDRVLVLWWD